MNYIIYLKYFIDKHFNRYVSESIYNRCFYLSFTEIYDQYLSIVSTPVRFVYRV